MRPITFDFAIPGQAEWEEVPDSETGEYVILAGWRAHVERAARAQVRALGFRRSLAVPTRAVFTFVFLDLNYGLHTEPPSVVHLSWATLMGLTDGGVILDPKWVFHLDARKVYGPEPSCRVLLEMGAPRAHL